MLSPTGITAHELARILGVTRAPQQQLLFDLMRTITSALYNELRLDLVEALESRGLAVAAKGRPKGLIQYAEEVVDYCAAADA